MGDWLHGSQKPLENSRLLLIFDSNPKIKGGSAVIDIEMIKHEIIERLKPLDPDKIILFGSYAYGTPTEDSDIDLFLVKDDLSSDETRQYELDALKSLRDIRKNYKTNGIDILSAPSDFIHSRDDYFYKVDLLQNGKIWYERTSS